MEYYNVHWKIGEHKGKTTIQANDKQHAIKCANDYMRNEAQSLFPFEGTVTKVIGPLGQHPSTEKQKLAQHYRSCMGAAMMLDKALQNVQKVSIIGETNPQRTAKIMNALALALSHCTKAKRDTRDLFKLMGLNVK